MVQLSEKIETVQKKYNPDLGLNFICLFQFGYTEYSSKQASVGKAEVPALLCQALLWES